MKKFLSLFLAHKAITIPATIGVLALGGGGITYGVVQSNNNTTTEVVEEVEAAEVETDAEVETFDYSDGYETALNQIENAILSTADKKEFEEQLSAYEDHIDSLTEEEAEALDEILAEIDAYYTTSYDVLVEGLSTLEEIYADVSYENGNTDASAIATLTEELNTLIADGKYNEASEKFEELQDYYSNATTYSEFIGTYIEITAFTVKAAMESGEITASIVEDTTIVDENGNPISREEAMGTAKTTSTSTPVATASIDDSSSDSSTVSTTVTASTDTSATTSSTASTSTASSDTVSTSTATTTTATTGCTHNWVAQTTTVHHDATGHYENVLVTAAYDEEVITGYVSHYKCRCGADLTGLSDDAFWNHIYNTCPNGIGSYYGYDEPIYSTVHHDAVYQNQWVQDTAAYDETITTGYVCSICGATK